MFMAGPPEVIAPLRANPTGTVTYSPLVPISAPATMDSETVKPASCLKVFPDPRPCNSAALSVVVPLASWV